MKDFLALKDLKPIAVGKQRAVFVHPFDRDLIVKVPTASYVSRRAGIRGKWYKKWHKKFLRSRHFLVFLRELREHLALRAAMPQLPRYVQAIVGFAETDLGMGLVSRAVRSRDGELAPTLKRMLQQGAFDEAARRHLGEFFDWLLESPVIVGDLNVGNLVYGYDPGHGHYFAVIDGLGEKNLLPLNSLSSRLNRRSKLRRIRRLERTVARLSKPVPNAAPARTDAVGDPLLRTAGRLG